MDKRTLAHGRRGPFAPFTRTYIHRGHAITVKGYECRGLVAQRDLPPRARTFGVCHAESGLKMLSGLRTMALAQQAVLRIAATADWTQPLGELIPAGSVSAALKTRVVQAITPLGIRLGH